MSPVFFKMGAIQQNECIIGLNKFIFLINNLQEYTEINTPDNVSSTLLSDFAFEIPCFRWQLFSTELSQAVCLALNT